MQVRLSLFASGSLFVSFSLASIAYAPAASAQGHDPAAAEVLYRSGKELAKKGDYAAACPKFAESQRQDPAPGTLLNLADCEEHVGLLARAWEHFLEAEGRLPRGDSRVSFARERAARLEKRVPHIVVRMPEGAPPGTTTTRDDQELGPAALGVPLPVDLGVHIITTHAPGHLDAKTVVRIAEGQSVEVVAPLGAAAPIAVAVDTPPAYTTTSSSAPVGATPSAARAQTSRSLLGWSLVGGGAIGLVTGTITGALALSRASTVKASCGADYTTCDGPAVEAAREGKTLSTVSTVGFIAGAALAGAGLYVLLSAPTPGGETRVGVTPGGFSLARTF
jgi:hypothetical protein